MANIKSLKVRIKSTKGTHKITSAMKLVSAAKLSRAQAKIVGLKPFSKELEETVRTVSSLTSDYKHAYFKETENKNAILLVVSSDKGLCGGYNSGLTKQVRQFLTENADKDFKVFYIGKKVKELIQNEVNSGNYFTFEKAEPTYDEVKDVADELAHLFTTGEVGKVYVAFNTFISIISTEPVIKQVLPLVHTAEKSSELREEYPFDFKYEPSAQDILETLIPEVFVTSLQSSIYDAIAAEHGSRMTSMENASKNCNELVKTLTLQMNKLRQAAITTELIEVVSGAESLNS
jgi:F-type H+-transporting ATPase subunit gamma